MAKDTPLIDTDKHKKLVTMVKDRISLCTKHRGRFTSRWKRNDELYRAYVVDTRKDKGGKLLYPRDRDIIIPMTYAVAQVVLTYLMAVFTQKSPMHSIFPADPSTTELGGAQNMETVIDYQLRTTRAVAVEYNWFQNALRYGKGTLMNTWDVHESKRKRRSLEPVYEERLDPRTGRSVREHIGMEEQESDYTFVDERNIPHLIDPNLHYYDPRVSAFDFHSGEFAGHRTYRSMNALLKKEYNPDTGMGYYSNLEHLKKKLPRAAPVEEYNLTEPRSSQTKDTDKTARLDATDQGLFPIDEMEMWIIPKEYEVGEGDEPEKWIVVLCNGDTIIRAEPSLAPSDDFSYHTIEFAMDGMSTQNPGVPEIIEGLQVTLDWFFNSHMANVRQALNNEFVVDPSIVEIRDILSPGPARLIRVRPDHYGFPDAVKQGIHQLPVVDVTQGHMKDMKLVTEMIQRVMPASDIQMGIPTTTRKTLGEVQNILMQSGSRLRLLAQLFSVTGVRPWIQSCVRNTQEFISTSRYYRILNKPEAGPIHISPYDLQGDFDYPVHDGTAPTDPSVHTDMWKEMMLAVAKDPELRQQFSLVALFKHLAQLSGIENIEDFVKQDNPQNGGPPGMNQPQVLPDAQVQGMAASGQARPI